MYSLDVGALGTFLANVISGWSPAENQNAGSDAAARLKTFKDQDLQVAKISGTSFSMTHKMGLLAGDIPAEQTAYGVITYDGNSYNASATGEKWERINNKCTSVNWNASTTFSSTDKPYNDGSTLFYIAKPNDAITISASVGTQLYAWTVSDTDTTIGDENEYKTFTIPIPDYSNAFNKKVWEFAYAGGARTWVAPHTGTYTMECWGAKGGSVSSYTGASTLQGGGGAYTSGQISINKNDAFYVYVGQESDINVESATKTFNGGGGCYWYKGGGTFKEGRGGRSNRYSYCLCECLG